MTKRRSLTLILVAAIVLIFAAAMIVVSFANNTETNDAMIEIESNLSLYKLENTVAIDDDGYIGIPVELSVFFDKENHTVKSGYGGTNIIIYVVNTMVERIGTDSDTTIIQSMLDRGYVVVVLDYLNNSKAVSPALDWSVQILRNRIKNKEYLTASVFPAGTYYENYVVPAGYNVSLNNVFWEADKHGTEGSLEKIVEVWNNDFKGVKGNTLVKWVHADGTRKKVEASKDGTAPQWYNANGSADANGEYTKVKWTVAEAVTDCVKPDGTPIDLNQYITLIYPTNPEQSVPVMAIANSGGSMATATQQADRPHFNGFLFDGYAGVVFDYLWIPMGRDDAYGYFDGSFEFTEGAVTGDQMTYSLHIYNDTKIYTAAMRYIRYMALSESDTYSFDVDKIGVFGNSKGGWATFLGEEVVQSPTVKNPEAYATLAELEAAINANVSSFTDKRFFVGHHGETRYDAGNREAYSADGVIVDGGEMQPWLTYDGNEIVSGASALYLSNGHGEEFINDGHVPTLVVSHIYDYLGAPYGITNKLVNLCRNHDIPSMFFEVPLDHTLTSGFDLNHGVDTYDAVYAFFGYYLKGEAVNVVYTTPKNSAPDVSVNSTITIKFTGPVDPSEISAITVKNSAGVTVCGTWSAEFGNTEWFFSPDNLCGGDTYTVTVPGILRGENGKAIGKDYTFSFDTEYDSADKPTSEAIGAGGYYVTFEAPALENEEDRFVFRFKVTNNAANVANIYAVESFNSAVPDSSVLGALLGNINLNGEGYYELDITQYLLEIDSDTVTLLLTAKNTAGEYVVTSDTFESGISGATIGKYSDLYSEKSPNGTNALKVVLGTNEGRYVNNTFYAAMTEAFSYSNLIKNGNLDESDYGRRFTVSLKVYDTASRVLQIKLSPCTNKYNYTMDYDMVIHNVITKANEWVEISFDYVVYDMDYGVKGGMSQNKALTVEATTDGCFESPIYFDEIKVTETVTAINAAEFRIAAKDDAVIPYRDPESEYAFTIYNGGVAKASYNSLSEALANYTYGDILRLNANYTFTDEDVYADMSLCAAAVKDGIAKYVIDLNGYTVKCENTEASLIVAKTTASSYDMSVSISNGAVLIGDTPLVSYRIETAREKTYSFEFNAVSFGVTDCAFARTYMSERAISLSAKTNVSMRMNDCVYDIPNDKIPANTFVLFPYGEGNLELAYEIAGGEIRIDNQRWVSAYDKIGDCLFVKDGAEKYTVLVMPACEHMFEQVCLTYGGYFVFTDPVKSKGYNEYTLTEISRSTKYGLIPEAYESAEDYPFALFDTEGNFITAAPLLGRDKGGSVLSELTDGTVGEWYILLRRDYVYKEEQFNNLALIYGKVTIDLGGHIFSCEQTGGRVFDFYIKKGNKTTVNVINGTFNTGALQLVKLYSGTTSSYNGTDKKTLEFDFERITFNIGKATSLVTHAAANVAFDATLRFTDCIFDMTNASSGFTLLDVDEDTCNMACNIEIVGGEFVSDSFEGLKIYNTINAKSKIEFMKNSGGAYSVAKVNAGGKAPTDIIPTADGRMLFGNPKTENGITSYEVANDGIDVGYGLIPSDFSSADSYPFAVFRDGAFIGAYATWKTATQAAIDGVKGNGAKGQTVTILLRRDFENTAAPNDTFTDAGGTIVVDLGGHTVINSANFFHFVPNLTNNVLVNETYIVIKNGTLLAKTRSIFSVYTFNKAELSKKVFNVNIDNVDFGYAAGADYNAPLFRMAGSAGANGGGTVNLTFNNCDFDFITNVPNKVISIFSFWDQYNIVNVNAKVIGGTLKCKTLDASSVKLNVLNDGIDTVKYFPDSNGNYTTLEIPVGASTASLAYNTDGGIRYFGRVSTDGTNDKYELISLSTEYGTIDASNVSPYDYPFAVFGDGAFIGAYSTWKDATQAAINRVKGNGAKGQTVTILLRRDFENTAAPNDTFTDAGGTIVVDLGGHTVTNSANLFHFVSNLTSGVLVNETTLVIKNGALSAKTRAVFSFVYLNNTVLADKIFNVYVDNVDIGYASGADTNEPLFRVIHNNRQNGGGRVNFKFNGCNFNYTSDLPSGKIPSIFNFYDPYNVVNVKTEIVGGTFTFKSLDSAVIKLNALNNGKDAVTYLPDANGNYTTLEMPCGASCASLVYETDKGSMYFAKVSTDGVADKYELMSPMTEYGTVDVSKISPLDYPFAIFRDATFVGAYATWKEAITEATAQIKGNAANGQIVSMLLRRDYNVNTGDTFDNLCDIGGTLVIDLGGNSLTRSATLFQLIFQKTNGELVTETNINIKNGNLLSYNNAIFSVLYLKDEIYKGKTFNVTLDNVDIGFAEGSAANNPLFVIWDNGRTTGGGNVNFRFNNCVFDLKTNAPTGKTIALFNFYDTYNLINVKAEVNGGSINADTLSGIRINNVNDGKDEVVYVKEANGNYTCAVLKQGTSAPAGNFALYGGKGVFVKISETNDTVTYRLRPIEIAEIEFSPKMSLTLDRNLILNLYVPKAAFLNSFTVDGKASSEYAVKIITLDNGMEYYVISIPLSAKEAARDIVLKANITVGEKTATGTFKFSIIKYAEKILADGTSQEQTLVRDVLSYVRAAYIYFKTGDAATIAKIDAILGDNYDEDNAPAKEGSATAETAGFKSASFVLDGTAAMRFYLPDGADASKYVFYIDGTRVKTESDENGTYIDIDVYAYALCETVTYTIDGTEGGSFHIRAYYEWSKTQNDENLTNLVARFWKYLQSARAYRDSVVEN